MIIISLGANVTSWWGEPDLTVMEALRQLERFPVTVLRVSRLYRTSPYGLAAQPDFVNAAALIATSLHATALLSVLKKIEGKAGRQPSVRWGPRALDIDIIDYNRFILNWRQARQLASKRNTLTLILPHPEIAKRAFVLRPILDIAPSWHHPIFGWTAKQMYMRLSSARMGRILEPLDDGLASQKSRAFLRR